MKFYKIIKSSNVVNSNIKLPEKFANRFKHKLAGHVTLEVPSGAKWRVEVEKSDDGVWLKGHGWSEFVDNLGLGNGHFLMFEFDEQSDVFQAVVVGIDASEIKYPSPSIDEDDVVFVTETHQPVKKRVRLRKDRETILDCNGQIQCVVQGRKVYTDSISDEAEQALARAKAFKVTQPVFIIALQPSYLSRTPEHGNNKNCQLLVPRDFIEAFFDLAVNSVVIVTQDDRTWRMVYRLSGQTCHFTCGWKQFAEDNKLTTGDVCLFELNRDATNVLIVSIFRTTGADEIQKS